MNMDICVLFLPPFPNPPFSFWRDYCLRGRNLPGQREAWDFLSNVFASQDLGMEDLSMRSLSGLSPTHAIEYATKHGRIEMGDPS